MLNSNVHYDGLIHFITQFVTQFTNTVQVGIDLQDLIGSRNPMCMHSYNNHPGTRPNSQTNPSYTLVLSRRQQRRYSTRQPQAGATVGSVTRTHARLLVAAMVAVAGGGGGSGWWQR